MPDFGDSIILSCLWWTSRPIVWCGSLSSRPGRCGACRFEAGDEVTNDGFIREFGSYMVNIIFSYLFSSKQLHPLHSDSFVPSKTGDSRYVLTEPLNISRKSILPTVVGSQTYWPYWMPSGPINEASCCMIVLAKSSVLQVAFEVVVQASVAALAAHFGPVIHLVSRKEWSITELESTCNVSSKVIRLFCLKKLSHRQ